MHALKERLKQILVPLSSAEQAWLLRALSDLESGAPRQWLFLEIAATLGPAQASRRARLLALAARVVGIAPLLPILERLHLPCMAIYQRNALALGRSARQSFDDAALLLVAFTALLAGFDRLPATRQFVACLLLLIGGVIKYWRVRRRHTPEKQAQPEEEHLPGAEAALGLQGLLLARGTSPAEVISLLSGLRNALPSTLPRLVAALPELLPEHPLRHEFVRATLAGWILALLPALWLDGWKWSWLLVILWIAGLAWFFHRRGTFVGLVLGLALASFALARIAHLM